MAKDGWRMFGAGCLGTLIGFTIAIALAMEQEDDRQADRITERVQRTIQFHFDHWRREIVEAQHGADS